MSVADNYWTCYVNVSLQTPRQEDEMGDHSPIAILFSGGLDSMILAAILDQCIDSKYTIDLLNVSFDGQLAPDRISARAGVAELQNVAPHRSNRWRLVEIDAVLSNLAWEARHLLSLIHPAKTYMCAGYGRHRTKYRLGGWVALHEEMRLDVQRIWKRNMGRDDRCISDHGKEVLFFLTVNMDLIPHVLTYAFFFRLDSHFLMRMLLKLYWISLYGRLPNLINHLE
ncbi:hypothetical protein BHE74_00020564 [Ensete ventricosum]|nr:hypothetical protein BHE74_00020564 [Ensete ventricosum]